MTHVQLSIFTQEKYEVIIKTKILIDVEGECPCIIIQLNFNMYQVLLFSPASGQTINKVSVVVEHAVSYNCY